MEKESAIIRFVAENESTNPLSGSEQDRPNFKPTGDAFQDIYGEHRQINQKPGRLASALGRIVLAGAAVVGAGSAVRATTENPSQPLKDAHMAAEITQDTISAINNQIRPSLENENQVPIEKPTETPEPQGAVGEEASSADPDLTELNKIHDLFLEELKKHPVHKMLGTQQAGIEGYKITIRDTVENVDKTVKFMKQKSESHPSLDKITIAIETDEKNRVYTILGNVISLKETQKNPSKENATPPQGSMADILTAELNKLYEQWTTQKGKNGENVASSTQNIPEPTNTPTPEPTPTNTPIPYHPTDRFRGIQEANSDNTSRQENSQS